MGRKRNPNSLYFTEETQQAIIDYRNSDTQLFRDKLFQTHIYFPFLKIAEVWYNKLNIPYIKEESIDAQYDCVSWMIEQLNKFNQDKGKAFSYFSIVARNYYIQLNMKEYNKVRKYNFNSIDDNFDIVDTSYGRKEEVLLHEELFSKFVEWLDTHYVDIFRTKREQQIGSEIILKLKEIDTLEDFNRNNLLQDIADSIHTKYKTRGSVRGYVTKVLNVLVSYYSDFKDEYITNEKIIEYQSNRIPKKLENWILKNYIPDDAKWGVAGIAKKTKVKTNLIKQLIEENK
jgi:ribosomal protein S17E